MFGGTKPTFGTTAPTGFGFNNTTAAASPFGQSAFGKPASAFGTTTAFGTQQAAPSLFGTTAAQPQGTGLFGGATTSTGFGNTTATQPTFGGFGQTQQNTSIFGATNTTSNTTSLFGQPATSTFGSAVKPGGLGGFGQQPTPSLFGQTTASTSASGFGGFGQPTAPTTSNVFGSNTTSAFGQTAQVAAGSANAGTTIAKYQPTIGTDTLLKGGTANNVSTKQHCITAMKEYENKSLEELRMEDYMNNRKGPMGGGTTTGGFFGTGTQPQAAGTTGLFGTTTQPTTGLFGQPAATGTENKGLFGTTSAFGQPAASAFGATAGQQQQNNFLAKPFGATNTGFGTTATDNSTGLFGAKPTAFGQPAGSTLFGQTTAASAAPAFGTNTGFGGFGTSATAAGTQQTSLFGAPAADANKPAFGLGVTSTTNTGFGGFGTTATSTAGGGLFGGKPATGFGAAPAFGATSTANTGFGNFSLGNTAGGGLFNSTLNKPATSFGGFGTQTSTAPLNFNTGGSSLFGNTANKPGGLFSGLSTNTGNTAVAGATGGTSFFGGNTLSGGFGTGGTLGGLGTNTTLGGTNMQQQQQPVPIHQQILSKVTSPYGDNPIFKDLKRNVGDETDASRATNPAAQKSIIESTIGTGSQFKVSAKQSPSTIKVKPAGSIVTKKSLFDGLDEFDTSIDSFTLKPNAKRLILKPKNTNSVNDDVSSNNSSPLHMPVKGNEQNLTSGIGMLNVSLERRQSEAANTTTTSVNKEINKEAVNLQQNVQSNAYTSATTNMVQETGRRESWLHPNNLEKVRQHNILKNLAANGGTENVGPNLNNTLSELVPRKPLDTYRGHSPLAARPSVSTVIENPFEDQSSVGRQSDVQHVTFSNETYGENFYSNRSYGADDRSVIAEDSQAEYEEHPTGIVLRRIGYYTIPSLDDLKSYLAEDSSCVVPNFTVGREGYGNVYFGKEMDVAGLNLDEIVHFRNKEVIIYPDDDNKPPVGEGLNREAQVTLDKIWPHDKTHHELIKDPLRLAEMDWEGRLRRVCDKNDTRFVEYRPETGSWVFKVKHFSKYGLNDSDEEEDPNANQPTDPKKAKIALNVAQAKTNAASVNAAQNVQKVGVKTTATITPNTIFDTKTFVNNDVTFYPMDESAEFMLMDKSNFLQQNSYDYNNQFTEGPTSPTSVLARDAGTDSHKLQLMKASFFVDDFDNKSESSVVDYKSNNLSLPRKHAAASLLKTSIRNMGSGHSIASSQLDLYGSGTPLPPASLSSATSQKPDAEAEHFTPTILGNESTELVVSSSKLPPLNVMPKVAPIKIGFAAQVPFANSIAYSLRGKWANDLGLFNSRRFKLGFGPQNTLIVPTTRDNISQQSDVIRNENLLDVAPQIFRARSATDYSPTVLQHVKISSTIYQENFKESVIKHLEIQLHNSLKSLVEGSECPQITADQGTDLLLKHMNESITQINLGTLEEYAVSVWSLCLALWGETEELEGQEPTSHFTIMTRRNLLSEWLENTLTDKDLLTKNVSKHSYLDHMLELIMCHKVTEACELAFMHDDANLALLLSQLSSGPMVRQLMEDQLAAWHKNNADEFIQLERLKMFMLVAGVSLMTSAHGAINTLEGIEWIKALALQLWYLCSPTSSITDALLAYEKSFKSDEFFAQPPTPSYTNDSMIHGKQKFYDLRYHLLQLYSKRSHPMESLLNPATHTPDPMDYRLSWLLLQTLEALGYHHCGELSENKIHVSFASQLENHDLWEWSIFVLLHIKDRNQRELAVQNMLYRYVSISKTVALNEKEKFVINNLGVPEKWIDYAKSVKAGVEGNYHLQAKYLLKAKQWSLAHDVIFQHIAPDAIINDNLSYLHSLLSQFEGPDIHKNVKVPNWTKKGQIFLDFIDITEKFKSLKTLKTEADIEARWETLKPQLSDLCSHINLLPCPTAKHRLCQSEIAQNLACLLRGVLLVCPVLNPCLIIKIALERLPLPQEFAQQELRTLLDTLVNDLSKSHAQRQRTNSGSEVMSIN